MELGMRRDFEHQSTTIVKVRIGDAVRIPDTILFLY